MAVTDNVDLSLLGNRAPQFSLGTRFNNVAQGFLGNRDLALALLANSGGPTRQSFGQILGQSGLQAQAMGQQRQQQDLENQFAMARLQAVRNPARKPIAVVGPDGKPILVNEDDAIGKTPYAGGSDSRPSAFIQAYDRYLQGGGKLGVMDFAKEFAANQAQYPYQVGTIAGEENLIPRTNPGAAATPAVKKLSTLQQEAGAKQTLASAGSAGAVTGTKTAEATFDLPRVEQNVNQAIGDIEKLRDHPGLKYITGFYSKAPIIPGTQQAAADAAAKQVQGQTFLQAYQQLRGSGAITEVEGAKGEAAVGRLIRSQSTEDYQSALDDLTQVLKDGLARAKKQAGANKPAAASKSTPGVINWEDLK